MRHDLYHAQNCRCGQCAMPITLADAAWTILASAAAAIVGLSIDPLMAAIGRIFA
ncbi:hypothetical protein [Sphingobium yanoikuyae]|uniref:hypothetical protein n=1 Tax=Sphingobium yanoikuyae TaxID=13690 RepID=UPI00147B93E0|nr:hypothetical protein [Sphingobium yanoikuyae]